MKRIKQNPAARCWRTPLALALASVLTPTAGRAENYFNPAFLSDDPAAVADKSPIPIGDLSQGKTLFGGQSLAQLNFYARYVANGQAVVAGTANASATFILTYA